MIRSDDQVVALEQIDLFLRTPDQPTFALHGDAGTGKTSLLIELAAKYPGAEICAPTNKAATNITQKAGREATTVHNLIYLPQKILDADGKQIGWDWLDSGFRGRLVLADECCMIDQKVGGDLIGKADKLIAFGDPSQLPPVSGARAFATPDFRLTVNHRQRAGSGIINQALAVKRGEPYRADGEFHVVKCAADLGPLLPQVDVVLCWRNETRRGINTLCRELLGLPDRLIKGEPIVCRKGSTNRYIFTGQILTVAEDWVVGEKLRLVELDAPIWARVEGFDPEYDESQKKIWSACMAPAYAMTTHNAQGSEFPRVLIIDECGTADRRPWLYTAITRAQQEAWIYRP